MTVIGERVQTVRFFGAYKRPAKRNCRSFLPVLRDRLFGGECVYSNLVLFGKIWVILKGWSCARIIDFWMLKDWVSKFKKFLAFTNLFHIKIPVQFQIAGIFIATRKINKFRVFIVSAYNHLSRTSFGGRVRLQMSWIQLLFNTKVLQLSTLDVWYSLMNVFFVLNWRRFFDQLLV